MKKIFILTIILVSVLLLFGCTQPNQNGGDSNSVGPPSKEITTFSKVNNEICKIDGKPVIRLFSTSWCSHCNWVKDIYDKVANEYVAEGKIVAYHWQLDVENNKGDNLLTPEKDPINSAELAIFKQFNDAGSIPTFVFGCQYYRIGNGFERQDNKVAEEAEFRAVIEELIKEAN